MTISSIDHLKAPVAGADQELVSEPSQADVDLFASALRTENAQGDSHLSAMVAEALADRLHSTGQLSQTAMRKMKNATGEDGNSQDLLQMSRAMSDYSLQVAVTTKVVSKSAQSLDKLTNLQ